jgi:tetratricopeptide (TPR) repeat protein
MVLRLCFLISAALGAVTLVRSETLLELGYRQMYNLEFDEAHRTFAAWQNANPNDPVGPASDAAAYLFTEFDRLHILQSEFFVHEEHFYTDHRLTPDPAMKQKFEAGLDKAVTLANRAPGEPNSQFALVMAHGLRSDYLGLIEKRYLAAFKEMKVARAFSEQLLAAHSDYADAWIAIGVENYMLSLKPAALRWLLRLGGGATDRTVGLEKLRITAQKGHYLLPFARLLLAVAALREHQTDRAREILAELAKEYPHNPLYQEELARLYEGAATP